MSSWLKGSVREAAASAWSLGLQKDRQQTKIWSRLCPHIIHDRPGREQMQDADPVVEPQEVPKEAIVPAAPAAGSEVSSDAPPPQADLRKARRKLSIMSDNVLIDGIAEIRLDATLSRTAEHGTEISCVVSSYYGSSKRGYAPYNPRKKNQDALIMTEDPETSSLFLCVLDGHGECGEVVSGYFQRELSKALFAHPRFADDPKLAFTESLHDLEQQLLHDSTVDTEFSGTTMVAAVIRGNTLTIFNVGDSRMTAGLLSDDAAPAEQQPGVVNVKAAALTIDHKPDSPGEKARIMEAGGRVFAVEYDDGVDGPPRVWLGTMDVPGLAMSRSLGDAVAHTAGVSSVPEVFERNIEPSKDFFIILATDGLWEFVSDQEAVDLAASKKDPQQAVEALIREANDRWMREEQVIDDTTVCVAFFGGWAGK